MTIDVFWFNRQLHNEIARLKAEVERLEKRCAYYEADAAAAWDKCEERRKEAESAEDRASTMKAERDKLREGLSHLCDNLDWEEARQTKLHEILEALREDVRALGPAVRVPGMFQRAQDAVYAMRARTDHHSAFRSLLTPAAPRAEQGGGDGQG